MRQLKLNPKQIPSDSVLWKWHHYLSSTEVPVGFQVATGLSMLGALLQRSVYFDQLNWKVWPNLSLLLVGPSGVGKDTAINFLTRTIAEIDVEFHDNRLISGKTMEFISKSLMRLGDPAAAIIKAPEITALMGGKDYQKSMVQELTDLLSTNDRMEVSTAGEKRIILRPTVTLLGGSTEEWLHRAMPDGSQEGGFFPRLIIISEAYTSKHVPCPKYDYTPLERKQFLQSKEDFIQGVCAIIKRWGPYCSELVPSAEALDLYRNWYVNRFKLFSPRTKEYANRSRDQVLKIAYLCAISRFKEFISVEDMEFAINFMAYVGAKLDSVVAGRTDEDRLIDMIRSMLPCTMKEILLSSQGFNKQAVSNAMGLMASNNMITKNANGEWQWKEED